LIRVGIVVSVDGLTVYDGKQELGSKNLRSSPTQGTTIAAFMRQTHCLLRNQSKGANPD
jgi:hypothetical protein